MTLSLSLYSIVVVVLLLLLVFVFSLRLVKKKGGKVVASGSEPHFTLFRQVHAVVPFLEQQRRRLVDAKKIRLSKK